MKFGLAFASSIGTGPDSALEICRTAEAVGFDSVWGGEHVIRPDQIESPYPYTADGEMPGEAETPIPDPLIWLAYVGAAAPTLRLGTCILIVPQRNPLVLAKELATLDHLTNGRVELGLGVGWLREEFEALGIPWARRGARNDEYVAAMRALWAGPHRRVPRRVRRLPTGNVQPTPSERIDPDPGGRRYPGRRSSRGAVGGWLLPGDDRPGGPCRVDPVGASGGGTRGSRSGVDRDSCDLRAADG